MSYPILPGLPIDGRIYRNNHMGTLEAVLPPGGHATAHAPTMIELDNGDLLCAWFAGSFEGSADISIVCSRLPKGAPKWDEPIVLSRDPERSEQNPSLFAAPNGEIWAMYTAQLARIEGKDNMQFTSVVRRQISFDGAHTWQAPEVMFPQRGSFCRQPIQSLSNGRWIFSTWQCSDSASGLAADPTVFQVSEDHGRTWRPVAMPNSNGRVHANVVELGSGKLIAFMRSRFADNIYSSRSDDFGDHWTSPEPTTLPNNNASISAILLASGRIAIAYNPTRAAIPGSGAAVWPGLRCPVAVALSEDAGKTFPLIRIMEPGEGFVGTENSTNNMTYEYPFIMQDRAGNIHLSFAYRNRVSIKWMSFSESDVVGEKREVQGIFNPTSNKVS